MSAQRTDGVSVQVDGVALTLAAGSSVAAALAMLPPGVARVSARGEPRAPLCGMGVCHGCRVDVDGSRRLACQTPCADGMVITTGVAR